MKLFTRFPLVRIVWPFGESHTVRILYAVPILNAVYLSIVSEKMLLVMLFGSVRLPTFFR